MTAKKTAAEAALAGLDFYVEHQITDKRSGDRGRFPSVYNVRKRCVEHWTTNWRTAVLVDAMLSGAYSIMALLRYAGASDLCYSL